MTIHKKKEILLALRMRTFRMKPSHWSKNDGKMKNWM